jgi:hypothetical protein
VSIETLLDILMLSVEEVTTRKKAVEDDGITASNWDSGDKFYLIKEEWLERFKQKESDEGHHRGIFGSGSSSGGSSGSHGKKGGGKKGSMGSDSNGDSAGQPGHGKDKCQSCGKIGHWAKE